MARTAAARVARERATLWRGRSRKISIVHPYGDMWVIRLAGRREGICQKIAGAYDWQKRRCFEVLVPAHPLSLTRSIPLHFADVERAWKVVGLGKEPQPERDFAGVRRVVTSKDVLDHEPVERVERRDA